MNQPLPGRVTFCHVVQSLEKSRAIDPPEAADPPLSTSAMTPVALAASLPVPSLRKVERVHVVPSVEYHRYTLPDPSTVSTRTPDPQAEALLSSVLPVGSSKPKVAAGSCLPGAPVARDPAPVRRGLRRRHADGEVAARPGRHVDLGRRAR